MHQPVAAAPAAGPKHVTTFSSKLRRFMITIVLIVISLWVIALLYLWFRQESLLFHPAAPDADYTFDLAYTKEIYIDVPGARLHALYLQQPPEKSRGIVLFLHGNAGNLKTWFTRAEFWVETGYDVLMPDYRGFGKSTGRIESEQQLHDDVLRIWNSVAPNYEHKKHVIYGRSLGSGLATKLASEVPTDLLILVSPYESMEKIASEYYPWVPGFLLRYPLRTDKILPDIHSRILLIHGTKDRLISIEHSRNLQKLNTRSELVEIEGAGHGDIHEFDAYTKTLMDALTGLQ